MTNFQLTVTIQPADLEIIAQAGQKIVLVRSLVAQDPSNVAWAVLNPAPSYTLEWNNSFGLYASQTEVTRGSVIDVLSPLEDALDQVRYNFLESNIFSEPIDDPSLDSGQYRISNLNSAHLTFGMKQSFSISGNPSQEKIPINAAFVPTMNIVTFEPLETTTIYLSSAIQSGQITTVPPTTLENSSVVTSLATILEFSSTNTVISVEYIASRGKFVVN